MLDYPIKFVPILKEKIWGGNKLKEVLHKTSEGEKLGESWEISGMENDLSVVENGDLRGRSLDQLLNDFGKELVGKKVFKSFGNKFPLLIKFIDAREALSVQLHPEDRLAMERHDSFGKTEMWYILQADEGAEINVGFNRAVSKNEYLEYLNSKKLTEILNFEKVKKGDAFFIRPGTVHAIGAGVLLAEIQQTSDVTYRLYDWDRVDASGKGRELHTDLALEALDLDLNKDFKKSYNHTTNTSNNIANCEYFTTNYLSVEGDLKKDYTNLDSFVIYMCVSGEAVVTVNDNSEVIKIGESILIPAKNKEVRISSKGAELLEVYIS
jgi:mannose-6-phosphate isomerase